MASPPPIPDLQDFLHQQNSFITPLAIPPSSNPTSIITGPINPSPSSISFKPKLPRHKPNPINSPSPSDVTRSVPPCTECGKRFLSWKALFGHMRCHPERQWRGINPPPNHPHRHPPASPPSGTHFTVDEYEVATSLIMLANGPRRVVKRKFEDQAPEEHKCGVCFREFPSGQALGGHMRCHVEGGGSSVSPRTDFVLDLNLPPPLEADGNDGGGLDLRLM